MFSEIDFMFDGHTANSTLEVLGLGLMDSIGVNFVSPPVCVHGVTVRTQDPTVR